jgi:hypothetical protein
MRKHAKSVLWFILLVITSLCFSGCLIDYSPKMDSVEITPNEPVQFSVDMHFPTPNNYEWYFQREGEGPQLISGATAAVYDLNINEVLGFEGDLTVIGSHSIIKCERTWHIIYNGTNKPPIAEAGIYTITDRAYLGQLFTLNGSGSTDPDNNITAYKWEQVSGPETVTLTTPNNVTTQFIPTIAGTFVFKLTVTDAGGLFDDDDATVISDIFRSITITDPSFEEEWGTSGCHSIDWTTVGMSFGSGSTERMRIDLDYRGTWYIVDSSAVNNGTKNICMSSSDWDHIITEDDRTAHLRITSVSYPWVKAQVQFFVNHQQ